MRLLTARLKDTHRMMRNSAGYIRWRVVSYRLTT